MRIASEVGGQCFKRGISIMRLALGYKDPLPADWVDGIVQSDCICKLLSLSFPDRIVSVFNVEDSIRYSSSNMEYFDGIPIGPIKDSLLAFGYYTAPNWCHFVIGSPTLKGIENIAFVVAISETAANEFGSIWGDDADFQDWS